MGYGRFDEKKYAWLLPFIEQMKNLQVGESVSIRIPDEEENRRAYGALCSWRFWEGAVPYFKFYREGFAIRAKRQAITPQHRIERGFGALPQPLENIVRDLRGRSDEEIGEILGEKEKSKEITHDQRIEIVRRLDDLEQA